MTTQLSTREQQPAPLFTPTPQAARRMLEFFTAQINNPHTRRAYLNAARRFAAWCQDHRIAQLAEVQPVHVAAFIQDLQGQLAPATVKQHLAALRILFDWLVTGALVHESELARNEPDSQVHHLPRAYVDGLPRSAIRLRMRHPIAASLRCALPCVAFNPPPSTDLYRKKLFSTRACCR